ncbi:MAG TPA: sensor histidine kinase, partial [Anaerolineae bacterium]|nr:sensor histidine kinase [Anaerolineae bacterium]
PGLRLEIEPSPVKVTPEQAHHLALVLGELVMNSAKYGRGHGGLYLRLHARLDDGLVSLVYRDRGPGYPPDVLGGRGRSLGLWLVDAIVTTSLQGEWSIRNEDGAVTELCFPVRHREKGGELDG